MDAAAGPGGIGPRVLKELVGGLAPALVPDALREGNDNLQIKSKKQPWPLYCRPVSLTSVNCKVMELVLRDAVTDHLTENHQIQNSQHGFMKGNQPVFL